MVDFCFGPYTTDQMIAKVEDLKKNYLDFDVLIMLEVVLGLLKEKRLKEMFK